MAAEAIKAGARLGPYELLVPVGAGGMGEVWKARDTRLDRTVAIKFSHAQFSERFEREARAIAALNHPNIAQIHDVGENYIVMEYVEGGPLHKPESMRQLIDITAQIAEGLAAAHTAGFVHRDLKPDNIHVTKSGVPKILDFGIARHVAAQPSTDDQTRTVHGTDPGTVLGTVGYMSPEQVRGGPVDHRSDIFSLGVIFYELLAGTRPFQRGTSVETMHAILKEEPPELSDSVAPSLRQVVSHALEKQPDRRFQSAQDFAFSLRASGNTTGDPPMVASLRPSSRRAWLTTGAAFGGAAVTGAAGYWFGARSAAKTPARFRKLTYREGRVGRARFTPDGGIVYAAKWGDQPRRLFYLGPNDPVARELNIDNVSDIASVSSTNELALILTRGRTLARAPLSGGAPRELLAKVVAADWSPDGQSLAVLLFDGKKSMIQYPIGNTLLERTEPTHSLRVSPSGDLVAYTGATASGFQIAVVGRNRKETVLTSFAAQGHVTARPSWTPDGRELWFDSPILNEQGIFYAVDLRGKRRVVAALPGSFMLESIFRDGRTLLTQWQQRRGLQAIAPGDNSERDLTWAENTNIPRLSEDGSLCVFSVGEGPTPVTYVRRMNGSPAVRLVEGDPLSVSPDGQWVQVSRRLKEPKAVLVPTGAGEERPFSIAGLHSIVIVAWLPEETYAVLGSTKDKDQRLYLWKARIGELRPIGPDVELVMYRTFLDPQRLRCLAQTSTGDWLLFALAGGEPHRISAIGSDHYALGWTADGGGAWVAVLERDSGGSTMVKRVDRLDLATGRFTLHLTPRIPTGAFVSPSYFKITPDGRSYVYIHSKLTSELHLAEGLV